MPVSNDELRASVQTFVSEDRLCVRCGYNLKGLKATGKCPECGRPIVKRRRIAAYSDNLVHAPIAWLTTFKLASLLMMFAAAGVIVLPVVIAIFFQHVRVLAPIAAMACAMAWWIGVILATRPRPVSVSTTTDPRREWLRLRWVSRVTQAGWPIAVGIGLVGAGGLAAAAGGAVAAPAPWVFFVGGVVASTASLGLIALCIYLSNVCYWAADSGLAINFRACAWTMSIAALACVFGFGSGFLAVLAPATASVIIWPLATIAAAFTLLATGHLLWCLWRLQRMASWAVIHNVTRQHQDERLAERQAREQMQHQRASRPR